MHFDIITLFPDAFDGFKKLGVTGRALSSKATLNCWNPRDYSPYKNNRVDDRPYGGGPGMVMMAEPLFNTLNAISAQKRVSDRRVIYLSPKGSALNQIVIHKLQSCKQLVLVAGRYEGIDQRFIDEAVDDEISIGDYVLSGGELACMVLMDAMLRQIEGVVGNEASVRQDSFFNHRLDHPQYTYPQCIQSKTVPSILLSGHHEHIKQWRMRESVLLTQKNRPDVIKKHPLSVEERKCLEIVDC